MNYHPNFPLLKEITCKKNYIRKNFQYIFLKSICKCPLLVMNNGFLDIISNNEYCKISWELKIHVNHNTKWVYTILNYMDLIYLQTNEVFTNNKRHETLRGLLFYAGMPSKNGNESECPPSEMQCLV